ncbi:MAG TPA: DEAD/DEAH box helicase [Acidimicrobiales bacterium]|nr:DEAD/DEAH box helicase [Acidimicrobiales bacterium]
MITPADEQALEQLVGSATFERGIGYAQSGAVRKRTWSPGGTGVVGEIQGGAARPYVASVTLTRSDSEQLSAFQATCTCPVGRNCKHAVALVLAPPSEAPSSRAPSLVLVKGESAPVGGDPGAASSVAPRRPTDGQDQGPKDWELPLQALLDSDGEEGEEAAEIGLQFELVLESAERGGRGPGIRVRPVIPGRNGNWVRTGVSWGSLDHFPRGPAARSPQAAERLDLVKEFLALSRLANGRTMYSYSDDVVRLEAISSRRLWDLLGEARTLGLPLLQSGRNAQPITLLPTPAAVTIDVIKTEPGLRVEPRIGIKGHSLPLETSMLIGRPAHGIAWWDERPRLGSNNRPLGLGLAALATPVDDNLRTFLRMATVDVPRHDEQRFIRALVPKLSRKVTVASSDGSVELPKVRPTTVVLTIQAADGHRLGLAWTRRATGDERRESLWDGPGRTRQRRAEDTIVDAATAAAQSVPELFERTATGPRLAPHSQLDGMAAVRFVADVVPALEAIEGMEIERIGTVPHYRESEAAPVVHLGGSESADNDWLDLTVTVSVGGEDVPFAELFVGLAEGRSHLILPSGTYFSLDREELRELAQLITEARGLHEGPGDGIRLSRFQASLWEDLQHLGVTTAQIGEWEASVRGLAQAAERSEHPAPKTLRATLRPYQLTGFNWLAFLFEHRLGGVLADDMGLGKTVQALALMCHTRERGLTDAPYLVVAPTSVVGNWAAECRRFAPDLDVVTITETGRRRAMTLTDMTARRALVITSYGLFRREYEEYAAIGWAGLFLDEAQFAKNRHSQTYQRAKTLPVSFKVAMSGTPIENNLMELWSLLSITAPGLFASPDRFGEHYRVPIEKQGDTDRLAQLRRRIRPLLLRRTKEQVASDLPDKQEQVLELDLSPKHKKVYQTYLQRERQKVLGLLDDMTKNRFEIFRSLTLLRQASLAVSLVDAEHAEVPSTKLDTLMELLEDIVADGHRVLVFSQFTRFLNLARDRIGAAGIDHCYLDGKTRNRPAVIADFREGQAPVFLISLKAGGFGLNLTEADYCILLDPWWNPATEAQAVDRVHRIGQTRKVMVYRLVAKDTLEEKVMALKAKKAALFSNVMDGGGFESGAMTAADIRDLLD